MEGHRACRRDAALAGAGPASPRTLRGAGKWPSRGSDWPVSPERPPVPWVLLFL